MSLEPVVRTLPLPCSSATAFEAFTDEIGQWWDARFSASRDELAGVVMEARVGGRLYEVNADGNEYDWGTVTDREPDRRITFEWTLGLATGTTSALDVDFVGDGDVTEMRLEHGGWDEGQERDRAKFDDAGGWNTLLEAYRRYIESER
jgi:hypothetical protein